MVQMANITMSSPVCSPTESHQHMQGIVVSHPDVPFDLLLVCLWSCPYLCPLLFLVECQVVWNLAHSLLMFSHARSFASSLNPSTTSQLSPISSEMASAASNLCWFSIKMLSHVHRCYHVGTDASSDLIWDSLSSICSILVRDPFSTEANSLLDHST